MRLVFVDLTGKQHFEIGTCSRFRAYTPCEWRGEVEPMLVERGLQVMRTGVVGDAYAIASHYLRRSGVISDDFVTNDRLLEIIVQMFRRGEVNAIRLANRAIARFESTQTD